MSNIPHPAPGSQHLRTVDIVLDLRNPAIVAGLSAAHGHQLIRLILIDEQGRTGIAWLNALRDDYYGGRRKVALELVVQRPYKETRISRVLATWVDRTDEELGYLTRGAIDPAQEQQAP